MKLQTYNILLMGETGTGKSTWINSFANYFQYESLDDALSDELIWLIPSTFQLSTTDDDGNFNMHTITIGDHYCESTALSNTQIPQVVSFRHKSFILNFIDVPGIGDTRGVETDNINMKAILNTVGIFDELHAICILLKPSDTKLTTEYNYCLNEVLMHLHRKALDNVFFIITHSTYSLGNAFTTLQAYLKELKTKKEIEITLTPQKLFYVDNEPYRFLCAYKQIEEFQTYDYSTYKESWKKSRMATAKFLKQMTELKPHDVAETLSVNQARTIILSMYPSLATITADFEQKKVAKKSLLNKSVNNGKQLLTKEQAKTLIEKELQNLEHEQEVISDAMIQFAGYLKQNAIIEYNTAFERQIKMEIQNEEAAVKSGGDHAYLQRLRNMLDEYIDRKEKLETALEYATDEKIDPSRICKLKKRIFALPIYGPKIHELYDKSTSANYKRNEQQNFVEHVITLSPF